MVKPLTSALLSNAHSSLYDLYTHTFEVIKADTEELRQESFRLRYQVYCVENPFEDPNANPDGMERDEFDGRAQHNLLIHRPTKAVVGTARTIPPLADDPLHSFPLQKVCHHPLLKDPDYILASVELSRFCISKQIRQRLNDGLYGAYNEDAGKDPNDQRQIPHAALGLFQAVYDSMLMVRAAYDRGLEHGIVRALAVVEPSLHRLLDRIGIVTYTLGPPIQYHGLRQPIAMNALEAMEEVKRKNPHIWKVLSDNGRIPAEAMAMQKRGLLK